MNHKVDFYFNKTNKWHDELEQLRAIALDCGLTEELKWGVPCYTYGDKNVVLIHDFKAYCAYLFMKGALMKDPDQILIQQTKNVQAARQIRFSHVNEVTSKKSVLKRYIKEAIRVEKEGLTVPLKKVSQFSMPSEFKQVLDSTPAVKKAFYALTPGRQRGYLLFFSSAKQAKTRESRVEKFLPQILKGKGLED